MGGKRKRGTKKEKDGFEKDELAEYEQTANFFFSVQAKELLEKHKIEKKQEKHILSLISTVKTDLTSLPPTSLPLSQSISLFTSAPLPPLPSTLSLSSLPSKSLSFSPPSNLLPVGPLPTHFEGKKGALEGHVHLAFPMPPSFFSPKDLDNFSYHKKRALFLGWVVGSLVGKWKERGWGVCGGVMRGDRNKPFCELSITLPRKKEEKDVMKPKKAEPKPVLKLFLYPVVTKTAFKIKNFKKFLSSSPSSSSSSPSSFSPSIGSPYSLPLTIYNNSLLEDLLLFSHSDYLSATLSPSPSPSPPSSPFTPHEQQALSLFLLWVNSQHHKEERGVCGWGAGGGGVGGGGWGGGGDGVVGRLLFCWMRGEKVFDGGMTVYQIFRRILRYLSNIPTKWSLSFTQQNQQQHQQQHQLNFQPQDLEEHKKALCSSFSVCFSGPFGVVNFFPFTSCQELGEVKRRAKIGLQLTETNSEQCFERLFWHNSSILQQFDAIYRFPLSFSSSLSTSSSSCLPSSVLPEWSEGLEKVGGVRGRVVDLVGRVVERGMGERCGAVRVWCVYEKELGEVVGGQGRKGEGNRYVVFVGLGIDAHKSGKLIDSGPPADDSAKVAEFTKLWGKKAEIRRFADGSIVVACVWSTPTPTPPAPFHPPSLRAYSIPTEIVVHLLSHHLSVSPSFVSSWGFPQAVSHLPSLSPARFLEGFTDLRDKFEKLSKIMLDLEDIPLSIRALRPISPYLRGTAVVPLATHPLAFSTVKGEGEVGEGEEGLVVEPVECVVTVESSSSWPHDSEIAMRRVKAAFYCAFAESLRANGIKARGREDQADVFYAGYVFRFTLYIPQHLNLLKKLVRNSPSSSSSFSSSSLVSEDYFGKNADKRPILSNVEAELKKMRLNLTILPSLSSVLKSLYLTHPSFGNCAILCKKFISFHLFSGWFSEEMVELMVAKVYLEARREGGGEGEKGEKAGGVVLGSPLSGLLRFLELLVGLESEVLPIVVDFDLSMTQEKLEKLRSKYLASQELFAIGFNNNEEFTLYKPDASLSPLELPVLRRLSRTSLAALSLIRKHLSEWCSSSSSSAAAAPLWQVVFTPSESDFDIVIEFEEKWLPKHKATQQENALPPSLPSSSSSSTAPISRKRKKAPKNLLLAEEERKRRGKGGKGGKGRGGEALLVGFNPFELFFSMVMERLGGVVVVFRGFGEGNKVGLVVRPGVGGGKKGEVGEGVKLVERVNDDDDEEIEVGLNLADVLSELEQMGDGLIKKITLNDY